MTNPNLFPNLFRPFQLWTDLGMRAAEMTLGSTQNFTEGADRLTRAVAGSDAVDNASAAMALQPASVDGIEGMQRMAFEAMTQAWSQWISMFGSLLAAGAGIGVANKVGGLDNPLKAVRDSLRPATWGEKPATRAQRGALTYATQRRARSSTEDAQHALASNHPKPRRKGASKSASKSKRSTRASRK
jgi:hypothetical protein